MTDPSLTPLPPTDDAEEDVDELALLGESTAAPPWVGMVTGAGLALAVVTALDMIGAISQGIAYNADRLNLLYQVGLAFVQGLEGGGLGGLALLLALLLVCLPTIAGRTSSDRQDRAAALTIGIATAFAVILMLGTIIGVLGQLEVMDLQGLEMTSRIQRQLATFVVRHVGTGAIALLVGLAALRVRFAPPAAALLAPDGDADAADADADVPAAAGDDAIA